MKRELRCNSETIPVAVSFLYGLRNLMATAARVGRRADETSQKTCLHLLYILMLSGDRASVTEKDSAIRVTCHLPRSRHHRGTENNLRLDHMIQTVLKRDGRIVGFNREKIAAAIRKAMLTTERGEDDVLVYKIVDRIEFKGAE